MRNLSRKFIALIAGFVALSIPSLAQNPAVFGGVANAWAFAYGVNPLVAPLQIDTTNATTGAGVATFTVAFGTTTASDGTVITPLATNAKVTVGTGANAETVTPSAVSCGTPQVYQSCSFTATFANAHGTGDKVTSGTFGFAEAVNSNFAKGGGVVVIDRSFIRAGGAVSVVTGTSGYLVVPVVQNIGTVSGSAFSYHSTGTSGSPAAYTITAISWY